MILISIKSKLRLFGKRNIMLFKMFTFFNGTYYRLTNYKTDCCCIEGFPRSANSYAINLIKVLNDDIEVSHHTHSVANVKIALRVGVPVVVLIRKPLDAIISYVLREGKKKMKC